MSDQERFENKDCSCEEGATLLEYAFLAMLIGVVCLVAVTYLGQQTSGAFSAVGSGFSAG